MLFYFNYFKIKYVIVSFSHFFFSESPVGAILKIVGIVVGALIVVCTLLGCCCKYVKRRKEHEAQVDQGSLRNGAESVPPQEEATSKV